MMDDVAGWRQKRTSAPRPRCLFSPSPLGHLSTPRTSAAGLSRLLHRWDAAMAQVRADARGERASAPLQRRAAQRAARRPRSGGRGARRRATKAEPCFAARLRVVRGAAAVLRVRRRFRHRAALHSPCTHCAAQHAAAAARSGAAELRRLPDPRRGAVRRRTKRRRSRQIHGQAHHGRYGSLLAAAGLRDHVLRRRPWRRQAVLNPTSE